MKEEIKLQWLPDPSPGGGWRESKPNFFNDDNVTMTGFDRFGQALASVEYRKHYYLPSEWVVFVPGSDYHPWSNNAVKANDMIEAMLLAEKVLNEIQEKKK